MNALATLIQYETWALIISLSSIVGYQLLTRRINTKRLLYEDGHFSAARVQLLMFTVGGALFYLSLVFENPDPQTLPEVPNELLLILGGSHVLYHGGRLKSLIGKKLGQLMSGVRAGRTNNN